MHLLQAGVDLTVIALWLGHESPETTHQYVEADLTMKEEVLTKTKEITPAPAQFQPKGKLLEFLDNLGPNYAESASASSSEAIASIGDDSA